MRAKVVVNAKSDDGNHGRDPGDWIRSFGTCSLIVET